MPYYGHLGKQINQIIMKKKLLILFIIGINLLTAQIPSYVPTNGLVGYYPFNGNANDESGTGNNGVVYGATLTTDRNELADKSYNFDGISNYIEVVSSSSLCVSSEYSISGWVNVTDFNSGGFPHQPAIISKIDDGDWYGGYEIRVLNNSSNTGSYFGTSGNIGGAFINILQDNHNVNQWYHLVIIYDGSEIKLFINDNIVASTTATGNLQTSTIPLRFGRRGGAGNNNCWYSGKIDDIGIWNRALTQAEITGLYTTLGTSQTEAVNQIAIYPNPAKDKITIDCGNLNNVSGYQVKIVNTLGQEVFSGAMNSQQYVIPLNTWGGAGMYFVKIYDASANLLNTKKIILQ
jgi:hypothetical protein